MAAVAERNASEQSQISPQSVLASSDRGTLKSLVMLRQIPGVNAVEDLTEQQMVEWLNVHSAVRTITSETLKRALTSVKMDIFEQDPEQRVLMLATDFMSALQTAGMESFIEQNPKQCVEKLLEKVQPVGLQALVRNLLPLNEAATEEEVSLVS